MKLTVAICLLFSFAMFAQVQENYVEYNTIQGELTEDDLFKDNFGRYDGLAVNLNEGEILIISVFSEEFTPALLLVSPDGKVFKENRPMSANYAFIRTNINQTGEWIVYIVGKKESTGDYFYQFSVADQKALVKPADDDLCGGLDYLVKHANAFFLFIESDSELFKLADWKDAFIDGDDVSYNSIILSTRDKKEADRKFGELEAHLKACLLDWKRRLNETEDMGEFSRKSIEFRKMIGGNTFVIQLRYNDFSNSEIDEGFDYSIDLVINKI